MYRIIYTDDALKDLKLLQKKAPSTIQKLKRLLAEIQENPRLGTGKAERLKGYAIETWSRRISQEHRLVYEIHGMRAIDEGKDFEVVDIDKLWE